MTWSADRTARLWNTNTGTERLRLSHDSEVVGAAWNGSEDKILTWGAGGMVYLWDAATVTPLFTLEGDESRVVTAQWGQDGRRILFVTQNGFAGIFYTQLADLLKVGCEQYATRNFTWQEWQLFFPGQPYRVMCDRWPVHPTVPEEFRPET